MTKPRVESKNGSSRDEEFTSPINVTAARPSDDTGFLIVVLKPESPRTSRQDLLTASKESRLSGLSEVLERFGLTGRPFISSVTPEELESFEQVASDGRSAPEPSLSNYWRIQVDGPSPLLDEVEAGLRSAPEVQLVYREKSGSNPVHPGDDVYSGLEHFLDPAKLGIDARWFWSQAGGDGTGMHFIDLEAGWLLGHEDLPAPRLIFNDNYSGLERYRDHGAAVLGIVSGVDNAKGIIGIAPNLSSVRTVSWFIASHPNRQDVANALFAALAATPRPHVVLVEVQLGAALLPAETDPGILAAIKTVTGNGVIVVEAGGNGDNDLDAWTDPTGQHSLRRSGIDSQAVLVGAGTSAEPHNRSVWQSGASNYGSRIDCYAWGDSVVSCGYGTLSPGTGPDNSYASGFGGTSSAAAIIAGAALLIQNMYFAKHQSLLSPTQIRGLLSNPASGTAQGTGVAGNIGVMPDLRKIAQQI